MTKSYKVADHIFNLTTRDGHPLWNYLGQYAPFECAPCTDPIFTLEVVRDLEPVAPETIYDPDTEPGETVVTLAKDGDNWFCTSSVNNASPVAAHILYNHDFTYGKVRIIGGAPVASFAVNNALMLQYAFRTAPLGTLEMHASVIRNNGRGYLFLAKSGTGKSTHSSLWLKYVPGSKLLNDDNPIVRTYPDGRVIVYGSPWSGKTPCYVSDECPVGAFVQIRRAPFDKITPLSVFESYVNIYSSSSGFKTDPDTADHIHATISSIVQNTRSYVLDCLPDEEAARVCSEEVLK